MNLRKHTAPKLKLPSFQVDHKLSKYLDDDPLLKYINKSSAVSFIGRAGSGKTSLMTGLLQTKRKFKKVFHKIYLFMPSYSRSSMSNCIFDCLPQDQIYNQLTLENLQEVYDKIEENTKDKLLSLIIFDDVQDGFKGDAEKLLIRIINNRRHLRTTLFLVCQSYRKMPLDVRKALTNHFLFNLSKEDYDVIYDERIYMDKKDWDIILRRYRQTNNNKGNFLFLDPELQKVFINWDEVIFDQEESSPEADA